MFNRIFIIIKNTFWKEIRRKSFIIISTITALSILAMNYFAESLTVSIQGQVSHGLGSGARVVIVFYVIAVFNGFLAILLSVDTVRSDFDTGMIQSILSRNISRPEYLAGRILGTWGIILFYYLASLLLSIGYSGGTGSGFTVLTRFALAMFLSSATALIWIVWGILASHFFPKLMSFLIVLFIMFMVFVSNSYFDQIETTKALPTHFLEWVGYIVHYGLPGSSSVNNMAKAIIDEGVLPPAAPLRLAHFILTGSILTGITFFLFQRKDIT